MTSHATSEMDPRALRDAFGSFMTGVTVVTTVAPDGTLRGFTANSFSSVSLDPPMLLVCPGKFLSSYDVFRECSHFAVNVLAEGQEEISNIFASYKGDRFAKVPHRLDHNGVPLIDGAVAQFSCRTAQVVPAGDHSVLMGAVTAYAHQGGAGLGYAGGQYFSLGLEREALAPAGKPVIAGAILDCGGALLLEETPEGFRPPQIALEARHGLRQELSQGLAARGLAASLGQAYSVYDDAEAGTQHVYLLGSLPSAEVPEGLVMVPHSRLPGLPCATPAISTMLTRYELEARTGDFMLYLGDTRSGDVHKTEERS